MKDLPSLKFNIYSPLTEQQISDHSFNLTSQTKSYTNKKHITLLQFIIIIPILLSTNVTSGLFDFLYFLASAISCLIFHIISWELGECQKALDAPIEEHRFKKLQKKLKEAKNETSIKLAKEYIAYVTQSRELLNYEAEELIIFLTTKNPKNRSIDLLNDSKDLSLTEEQNEDTITIVNSFTPINKLSNTTNK